MKNTLFEELRYELHRIMFFRWYESAKRFIGVNTEVQEFSIGLYMGLLMFVCFLSFVWTVRAVAASMTIDNTVQSTDIHNVMFYSVGMSGSLITTLTYMARRRFKKFKRGIDFLIALVSLVVFWPLIVVFGLLIKLDSPGPVFFRQKRVGRNRTVFMLWKFRTMVHNAERCTGPVWALSGDPRITRIGGFLRRTRLDALPSLLNVIRGDMALVGPAPERPEFVERIQKRSPRYQQRFRVKPGITGLSQVRYGYITSIADAGRSLRFDLLYIERMCATLDLKILYWTVLSVVKGFYYVHVR